MMLEESLQHVMVFISENPLIGVGGFLGMAALFYVKPKLMSKAVGLCFFLIVMAYIVGLLAETVDLGSTQKDQMVRKTQTALGE